jgi:hypothetical protein
MIRMTQSGTQMKSALLAVGAFLLAGCDVNMAHTGPEEHEVQSVDLDKSELARVEIKMGVGELTVDGGSPKMLDADFTYNIPSWKPSIRTDSSSFRKQITIEQPRGGHGGSHVVYKWNLHLNDTVPLDLTANLGAGEARMNLGTLNLRSLEMNVGVGEVKVDLRGKPSRDYTVNVHGGVGQVTIRLPHDVGIVANARGGIGNINVRGLEQRGGMWINPAHENAPVTIHIEVNGGIGNIQLLSE